MMEREWTAILNRYGQEVSVCNGGAETAVHAFLQPVLERGQEQSVPTPLGLRREDRFLYLGPAELALTAGESRVYWNGQDYEVQSAHPVGGTKTHHWWAVLRPVDREGA